MEVQIQFTSRPERPDSLIKSERQKTQEPRRRIQNKSKHHSSFRLRFSAQSVKKKTSRLILSSSFFFTVQPVLVLSSSLPPSLFHSAKNHRTGNGGLSFSYLSEQRAHRAAKDCSALLFFLPSFPSFISQCFAFLMKRLSGNGLHCSGVCGGSNSYKNALFFCTDQF